MESNQFVVECHDCGFVLDESFHRDELRERPCPRCGSFGRLSGTGYRGRVCLRGNLLVKSRPPTCGRFFAESRFDEDVNKRTGRPVKRCRIIDRDSNRYFERVIDIETGEVIHECNEPLSNHKNHGSARNDRSQVGTNSSNIPPHD